MEFSSIGEVVNNRKISVFEHFKALLDCIYVSSTQPCNEITIYISNCCDITSVAEKLCNVQAPGCGLALVLPSLLQGSQRKSQHLVRVQSASTPT